MSSESILNRIMDLELADNCVMAEYIWIDGSMQQCRSKTKVGVLLPWPRWYPLPPSSPPAFPSASASASASAPSAGPVPAVSARPTEPPRHL